MKDNVVHIGNGTDLLREVPAAPKYFSKEAAKHWKIMGGILAKTDRLKETYLSALEVYSEAMAQWQFALTEIRTANKEKHGSGYVQKFNSGASNVSVYVTLKDKAEDSILKCCKIFGLDPKSEKELKTESGQYNLFEELLRQKTN